MRLANTNSTWTTSAIMNNDYRMDDCRHVNDLPSVQWEGRGNFPDKMWPFDSQGAFCYKSPQVLKLWPFLTQTSHIIMVYKWQIITNNMSPLDHRNPWRFVTGVMFAQCLHDGATIFLKDTLSQNPLIQYHISQAAQQCWVLSYNSHFAAVNFSISIWVYVTLLKKGNDCTYCREHKTTHTLTYLKIDQLLSVPFTNARWQIM